MTTTWVDFKRLKADVAIEEIVAHYGVRLRRIGATELRGRCPLPTHTSSRSRDSFAVNIARNVWSCRSQSCMQSRGGRTGGNILDLVALIEGCSIREAALRLQAWSGTTPERFIVPRASRPDSVAAENPPLRFALQYIDARHPYLTSRGVTPQTVRTFGLGLYTGKGLLRGRIVIPIHNSSGELIAYASRAIEGEEPRYRFPTGFRKSLVLFNLHRAIGVKARAVVVVEGFFDAIALHQGRLSDRRWAHGINSLCTPGEVARHAFRASNADAGWGRRGTARRRDDRIDSWTAYVCRRDRACTARTAGSTVDGTDPRDPSQSRNSGAEVVTRLERYSFLSVLSISVRTGPPSPESQTFRHHRIAGTITQETRAN